MAKITFQQMVKQWLGASHRFDVNLTNAEAGLAHFAYETYSKSFDLKRFNSKGAPAWRAYKGTPKPTHISLLYETGALKRSLAYYFKRKQTGGEIKVWTDEKKFVRENRNARGECFAAIHNNGGLTAHRGSKAYHIQQRQFMPVEKSDAGSLSGVTTYGDSSYMGSRLNKLHVKIFYGFPK